MLSIIATSFWTPLRDIRDVVKIFWPFFLVALIVGNFYWFGLSYLIDELRIGAMVLSFLYLFMVSISGVVQWHRKIVLGLVERARFIPKMREWRYLGYIFLFGVVSYLYDALFVKLIEGFRVAPLIDEAPEFLSFILSSFLFAFLFKRFVLVLPRLSVEKDGFLVSPAKLIDATRGAGWPLTIFFVLILSSMIPLLLAAFFYLALSTDPSLGVLNNLVTILYSVSIWIVLGMYFALVFATLLSLFYRLRVRPQLMDYNDGVSK